jgi:CheY-like chemotaxis protein
MLIVDDEKIVGETLASIFTTRGHVARAAQSAEEAIEVLAELAA